MAARSKSVKLTDENFHCEVLEGTKLALVVFSAEWCGPCHMIAPLIDDLASEFKGQVKVGKLDVDHNPCVVAQYGIRSTPSLLFFKDGHVVNQVVGVASKRVLAEKLHNLLRRA